MNICGGQVRHVNICGGSGHVNICGVSGTSCEHMWCVRYVM